MVSIGGEDGLNGSRHSEPASCCETFAPRLLLTISGLHADSIMAMGGAGIVGTATMVPAAR